MTLTTPANATTLLSAFTWSLLYFFWQGAILAMALGLALKISKRNSPRLRYVICCIVLGCMVLCPIFTCAWFELSRLAIRGFAPVLNAGSGPFLAVEYNQIQNHFASLISWTDRHTITILILWSTGVFFSCARVLVSVFAAQRLKRRSLNPAPGGLQSLANQLGSRLKLSVPLRLVSSHQVMAPVVVGWREPAVLLPSSSLESLSLQQTETVLAHELAHIQRGDYLVNLLQATVEALLFYHPAIWWVSRQIRREREHCCDDLALSVSGSAVAYAKALTMLEEQRSWAQIKFSLGMSGGDLSMRIKRLFDQKDTAPYNRGTGIFLAALGAVTIAALALLSIPAIDRVSAQTAEPAVQEQHQTATATKGQSRPDVSCTYYDDQKSPHPHPGVCGGSVEDPGVFYCRQTDGKPHNQLQAQIGCAWKVQRLRDWERQHGQNQSHQKE